MSNLEVEGHYPNGSLFSSLRRKRDAAELQMISNWKIEWSEIAEKQMVRQVG